MSTKKTPKVLRTATLSANQPTNDRFPIVGIGASAGGLEALDELLGHLPADTGMAFVIVTHQHPSHASLLPELLSRETQMAVSEAVDGIRVLPNHVYVGTPGGHLAIINGTLQRMETSDQSSARLPIDYFFRSLADDQKEHAICIVLSGTGTDGTLGLRAIKGATGMAMVQQPQSAKYAGMPSSAEATGLADYVLPPAEMPARLIAYTQGPYLHSDKFASESSDAALAVPKVLESIGKIFVLLRDRSGHDFSGYKPNTIRRRIERRMNIHQITDPKDYVRYLQANPHEIDALFKELLISVTSFFRDPQSWEALAAKPLPELLGSRPDDTTLRAWVAGCATGEEVYTLAIVMRECAEQIKRHFAMQIFGTDLDSTAIESARLGRFPAGISSDLSPQRLQRWFTQEESTLVLRKEIREMAIFAPQNLIKDPPFTNLDIIACRNLLVYLDADLQKRLIPIFHYALKPGGLLILGSSETIGQAADLFETLDTKWKIYRRKEISAAIHSLPEMPAASRLPSSNLEPKFSQRGQIHDTRTTAILEHTALEWFSPTFVVVNERGDLLHVHGRTGDYFELAQGQVRTNVLDMAREGLARELASLIRRAVRDDREVMRQRVLFKTNGDTTHVDLAAFRIKTPEPVRGLILITFRPSPKPRDGDVNRESVVPAADAVTGDSTSGDQESLERELQFLRETHQMTLEELETSNEELKSINEELQSTNEEMQSTNEELETSKEEMQSLNEELTTVNVELQSKVDDLSQANDDLQNLLNSTDIATIFLGDDLTIKRYTESATRILSLRSTDVGRPIGDLRIHLKDIDLVADCRAVINTLVQKRMRVETEDGAWCLMRILPYRTAENAIDGLVLTFVDIQDLKVAEELGAMRAYFEAIFNTVREPLLVLDSQFVINSANRYFFDTFRLRRKDAMGKSLAAVAGGAFDVPTLFESLEEILANNATLEDFVVEHEFATIGAKRFLLNARRLDDTLELEGKILMAVHEVVDRPEKHKELR
ncbi:MAG: PAS domain-containing protein [Planctomycetales bacterium]|nr:PAS domain-containing protein [Planctomycetales bacterium]